ncbi:MAG: hypothetical protein EOP39_11755, partial [Rubrivivax sp.]
MSQAAPLPRWIDIGLLPLWNLAVALLVAGVVVKAIGHSPWEALTVLLDGALGSVRGLGYSLYYATTFIFTGLAVAVAIHAGLFNIGGEGQAALGGLGVALVALWLGAQLPAIVMLPLLVLAAAVFGMLWAAVPAYLQAWRGSHVVITTIMFNFLAAGLNGYLLVNWLRPAGSMAVESAEFAESARQELLSGEPDQLRHYLTRERRDKRFDAIVHRAIKAGKPVAAEDATRMLHSLSDFYRSTLLDRDDRV